MLNSPLLEALQGESPCISPLSTFVQYYIVLINLCTHCKRQRVQLTNNT